MSDEDKVSGDFSQWDDEDDDQEDEDWVERRRAALFGDDEDDEDETSSPINDEPDEGDMSDEYPTMDFSDKDEEGDETMDEKPDYSDEFPLMNDDGTLKEARTDDPARNMLSPEHEFKREELINKRIAAFKRDAHLSSFTGEEVEDMVTALTNELNGEMLDDLLSYSPQTQSDFQRLKFKLKPTLDVM